MSDNKIEIFTDGACKGNPGPGGWGALLRYGDKEKEINGFDFRDDIGYLSSRLEYLGLGISMNIEIALPNI